MMLIQSALLGGLFIGILSALPFVNLANCCCLWIVGGGVLTAYLDQQNNPRRASVGRGALGGLLAGLIGAAVWLIAAIALDVVVAPLQERMIAQVLRNAQDMPPEVREWLEMLTNRTSSVLRYVVGFAFHLCAGVVFATLGGVIGHLFFRRGPVPPVPGDIVLPPLPD